MFSKFVSRSQQVQYLTGMSARAFRTTAAVNVSKKPSIGDAVTILQSKVSGINQVVSKERETPLQPHANKIAPVFPTGYSYNGTSRARYLISNRYFRIERP